MRNGKTGLSFGDSVSGLLLLELGLATAGSGFWSDVGAIQAQ